MNATPEFVLFGTAHVVAVVAILGGGLGFALWAQRLAAAAQRRIALLMALALVLYRTAWTFDRWLRAGEPLSGAMPLHLCGLMFYLCAWMLWRRDYRVFEITYFWALGGTLLAMVTPDLAVSFPHPLFFDYFLSHGALVVSLFYAVLVFRFRPTSGSVWRAWLACLAYAAALFPLNYLLDTNYMFLRQKPTGATLLDALGPWPWYIASGAAVGLFAFFLWYLPFALTDRYSAASGSGGRG